MSFLDFNISQLVPIVVSGPLHEAAKRMKLVWNLVVALWGQLDENDLDLYNTHVARRHALCEWLVNACKQTIQDEVEQEGFEVNHKLSHCLVKHTV